MSETLKRITPAEVVEAYRKTGLHIGRHAYFSKPAPSKRECACGVGAYCAANFGVKNEMGASRSVTQAMREAGFNDSYRWGFISGFDDEVICEAELDAGLLHKADYAIGYTDGRAAYEAAKEAVHVD